MRERKPEGVKREQQTFAHGLQSDSNPITQLVSPNQFEDLLIKVGERGVEVAALKRETERVEYI